MLFPALGLSAAMWLIVTPLLGIETGFRADLAVTAGMLAIVLLPIGIWVRKASAAAGAVGIVLGFANFFLDAPIGSYASLATCGVTLLIGAMAPWPVTVKAAVPFARPADVAAIEGAKHPEAELPAAA
jgi:hypothetical protein